MLQSLIQRHPLFGIRCCPGIITENSLIAIRAYYGNRFIFRQIERKDIILIFQQNSAFVGYLFCQCNVFVRANHLFHQFRVTVIRTVEQAQSKLHVQNTTNRLIDISFIDFALFHLLLQRFIIRIHVQIHTGNQRNLCSLFTGGDGIMKSHHPVHRPPVGINIPFKAQFITQHIRHIVRRSRHGYAIICTVTTHDAQRIRLLNHTGKRVKIDTPEFPFTATDKSAIQTTGRCSVSHEMFGRTGYLMFLVSFHKANSHFRDKERIFSIGLLYSSPT